MGLHAGNVWTFLSLLQRKNDMNFEEEKDANDRRIDAYSKWENWWHCQQLNGNSVHGLWMTENSF